ncbi:MAG: hypothetical protein HYS27_25660 [Deltaproteobacteria bacterium]|nr:hypothetical protein [Deltaproteobacteria bacterium]
MTRHIGTRLAAAMTGALAILAVPLGGCFADNGSVFIEGILPINRDDDCVVDPEGGLFVSGALLDVGAGADAANALVVAARVVTNLPNTFQATDDSQSETRSPNYPNYGNSDSNVINFTETEVFYTTDQDRDGQAALTGLLPGEGEPPLQVGIGGTVYNTQSQLNTGAAIIATVISKEYAGRLQGATFPDGTALDRILVNIRFAGTTTGEGAVKTPPFVFPVQICQGCLVVDAATCANGTQDTGCVRGVDYPTVCAP